MRKKLGMMLGVGIALLLIVTLLVPADAMAGTKKPADTVKGFMKEAAKFKADRGAQYWVEEERANVSSELQSVPSGVKASVGKLKIKVTSQTEDTAEVAISYDMKITKKKVKGKTQLKGETATFALTAIPDKKGKTQWLISSSTIWDNAPWNGEGIPADPDAVKRFMTYAVKFEADKAAQYWVEAERADVSSKIQSVPSGVKASVGQLKINVTNQAADTALVSASYRIKITQGKAKETLTNQQATFDLQKVGEVWLISSSTIWNNQPWKSGEAPSRTLSSTPKSNLPYVVVDTGQDKCYNNTKRITSPSPGNTFYGQDAQYDGNQPNYTVGADGLTVYDNVTGLTWTQGADWTGDGVVDVDDKFTYDGAQSYVGTLNAQNYGGFNDWRVPSIKELYSLIDYRGTDPNPTAANSRGLVPFIDDDVFEFAYGDTSAGERIIDSQWVTTTLYVSKVMNNMTAMFGVNFADGRIKGYPTNATPHQPEGKLFYARFCRGNTDYGKNDFTNNGNGTITDKATGLMWSQSDSGKGMNWEDALAWVQQKNDENYLGYNDWRLPNAKELQSLVDYTRSPDTTNSAAIDPLFKSSEIIDEAGKKDYPFYWSSTTFLRFDGSATFAVYVSFGEGLGSMDGRNVIDVHGAGCQRSDPKDGNPSNYPSWGHGPQGDVQRVFNYVRCVRTYS